MPELRQVRHLFVSDNETIAHDLSFLWELPDLETLQLRRAGLRDRHAAILTRQAGIADLDLAHNRIAGDTLDELAALHRLRALALTGTLVTDATVARLETLQILTRFKLGDTPIGDSVVPHLARLRTVDRLWLTRTHLTDEGLGELVRTMPQLRTLDLSMTGVTTDGLHQLRHLPKLFRLEIAPTQLTDRAVEMLADATTIREIGLRGHLPNSHLFGHIADTIGAAQILPDT